MKKRLLLFMPLLAVLVCLSASSMSGRGFASSTSGLAPNVSSAPGQLQVYVLDVGQGQSILIISPLGKAALIDAGPADAGGRVVAALRKHNVRSLEVVVATQAGEGYIGGMRRVVGSSDIVVKSFVDSAQPWKNEAYNAMLATVRNANIPVTPARRGLLFDLGGGARLDIYNPVGDGAWVENTRDPSMSRENINSVVLRLIYKDFAMLVMSGAEAATAQLLFDAQQNIWAPVLIVGNHGSTDATNEKMLSRVQPRIAVISTSAARTPAPETLERLRQTKAEIYRTDTGGDIAITSDGKKHQVVTERK